jgi:hypothetical protein
MVAASALGRSNTMRHWKFWEWAAYGSLFVAAMIVAAETGVRIAPDLFGYVPEFVRGAVWGLAPLTLVVVATIILLLREFVFFPPKEAVGVPQPIPTHLRLQFQPNSANPRNLLAENVWYWYALCNIFKTVEPPSELFKNGRTSEHKFWSLFLVFDKPVAIKQITFDSHGAAMPLMEVKDKGPRHAVIVIAGDVGGAVLDINVVV